MPFLTTFNKKFIILFQVLKDSNPYEWIWNPLCYQLHQRPNCGDGGFCPHVHIKINNLTIIVFLFRNPTTLKLMGMIYFSSVHSYYRLSFYTALQLQKITNVIESQNYAAA